MSINPNYYYRLALSGYFGLFALLMLWNTVLVPTTGLPVALILLVTITPLLLPLRGFLNNNRRSCSWMAYVSLIYFIHGSVATYANNNSERLYTSLETLLSLMLFFGATLYVHYTGKQK
jgi:uncharacterized membrane protein